LSEQVEHHHREALRERLRGRVRLSRNPWVRWALLTSGALFVVAGVLGLLLPALPGTPLLLLAGFCFAQSSERCYIWLMTNRWFGRHVRNWSHAKGIPPRVKAGVILFLLPSFTISIYITPLLPVQVLLGVIGALVVWYILRLPNAEPPNDEDEAGTP